jgi:hypothetical protein
MDKKQTVARIELTDALRKQPRLETGSDRHVLLVVDVDSSPRGARHGFIGEVPLSGLGDTMEKKETIRIELTDEQKKQIKDASGQDVQALEITAQELEQRIAPLMF